MEEQGDGVASIKRMLEVEQHEVQATGLKLDQRTGREVHALQPHHPGDITIHDGLVQLHRNCHIGSPPQEAIRPASPILDVQVYRRVCPPSTTLGLPVYAPGPSPSLRNTDPT